MKHTIDYIESHPDDFKVCTECGAINWYENKQCIMCHSKSFRGLTEKDIKAIKEIYGEDAEIDT